MRFRGTVLEEFEVFFEKTDLVFLKIFRFLVHNEKNWVHNEE
jgi:hypothetical protein